MSGGTSSSGSVAWAVAIHVAIAAALTIGVRWPSIDRPPAGAPIQATLVDPKALTQRQQQRERDQRAEQQRKQREEQQAREVVEQKQRAEEQQKQREKDLIEKRDQQRVAEEQKKRDDAQKQREKEVTAKREQERVAQQQREKDAADKRAKDDAARKQREAAAAAKAAEAEAQRELEAENARRADMLDKYIADIASAIERNWARPASAQEGLDCMVRVVQVPGGVVADVRVVAANCNGDDAVQRSIEAAVIKASPLPKPDDPRMFDRNLNVRFKPHL